jgi:hypothetical protein
LIGGLELLENLIGLPTNQIFERANCGKLVTGVVVDMEKHLENA